MVPPHSGVSGLVVNPLVKPLEAGKSTLIEIKYDAKFRDLTYSRMNEIFRPKIPEATVNGLVAGPRNKKLEARIKKQKEEEAKAQVVDPKAKGKAPAPAAKPAPEVKKPDPKAPKKTQAQIEEEEAEERRKVEEAEAAERARLQALEDAFDRDGELRAMGGRVYNFDVEEEFKRT